jgi:hypothetical protein
VAKRAVRPELRFTQLRGFRIASKRILVLCVESYRRHAHNHDGAPKEKT